MTLSQLLSLAFLVVRPKAKTHAEAIDGLRDEQVIDDIATVVIFDLFRWAATLEEVIDGLVASVISDFVRRVPPLKHLKGTPKVIHSLRNRYQPARPLNF